MSDNKSLQPLSEIEEKIWNILIEYGFTPLEIQNELVQGLIAAAATKYISEIEARDKKIEQLERGIEIIRENFYYTPDQIGAIKDKAFRAGFNSCNCGW